MLVSVKTISTSKKRFLQYLFSLVFKKPKLNTIFGLSIPLELVGTAYELQLYVPNKTRKVHTVKTAGL